MLSSRMKHQIIALINKILAKLNLQEFKAPRVRGLSAEENLVLT